MKIPLSKEHFRDPICLRSLILPLCVTALMAISGCSSLIAAQTGKLADNISMAMLDNDDPQLVSEAMPTFLILIDSMARDEPDTELLIAAAKLNGAYAGIFLPEGERQQKLSSKSFNYAKRAACQYQQTFCSITTLPYKELQVLAAKLDKQDVALTYTLASSWLGYIQAHSDDWQIVADLPKVKLLLEKVIILDESYDYGGAHLYLGGIATLLPPSLGGKPEIGRSHFERAIELSQGQHLLAKVEYARRYARLVFDQELHHQLLKEVLAADIHAEGLTLINALAQQQATQLLAEEADYF